MTAQILDTVLFKGNDYWLIGMTEGSVLASPEQFGMEPDEIDTSCYRGFYATYELTEKLLYLRKLTLRVAFGKYLPIGDIQPEKENHKATYHGLDELIPFTGRLRLAKDFIRKLYVHMGYQSPTAFKTVLDISLKEGKVVEIKDRSLEMKQKRGAFKKRYDSLNIANRTAEAFDFDIDSEVEDFNEEEIQKLNDAFDRKFNKEIEKQQKKKIHDDNNKNFKKSILSFFRDVFIFILISLCFKMVMNIVEVTPTIFSASIIFLWSFSFGISKIYSQTKEWYKYAMLLSLILLFILPSATFYNVYSADPSKIFGAIFLTLILLTPSLIVGSILGNVVKRKINL
jgi:hypothetical protein